MSNEAVNAMREAGRAAGLAPGVRYVLWVLADRGSDHSGEDWTCFPSINLLMKDTGFSRSAVEGHLRALDKAGFISRDQRTRPDGGKGVYDFTLHRCAEHRAALSWARMSEAERAEALAAGSPPPPSESTHGVGVETEGPTLGFSPPPPSESEGHEPSENPQREPSLRARAKPEPGDQGVEAGLAAWPASGLKRTDEGEARAAWAWAAGEVGAARLMAAVRAAVASGELEAGDHGAPGLQRWLSGARWRPWLAQIDAAEAERRSAPRWAGPAEVWPVLLATVGPFAAAACGWDGEAGQVQAPTRISQGQLLAADAVAALAALTPPVTVSPTLKPKQT